MECLAWLKAAGALHVAKVCSMVAVIVLVLVFDGQRPKVPHIYHTNDPYDTQRNGASYVCGCSLPTSLETPQNPTDPPNSSWNVCYDTSSLKTATVVVYPSFTEPTLQMTDLDVEIMNAYGYTDGFPGDSYRDMVKSTEVDGYVLTAQAHDLDWGDDRARFENYTSSQRILNYDGYDSDSELFVDVKDLEKLLDFPAPYVAVKFAFRCSNCSSCNLHNVTGIFKKVFDDDYWPWGECTYWGEGDECALKNRYQAMCTMYPNARVPFAFGIKGFFQDFNKLLDINDIRPLRHPDHVNHASFVSNELFVYLYRLVRSKVILRFLEIEKLSPASLLLLNSHPGLVHNCTDPIPTIMWSTLRGTLVCNIFSSRAKGGYSTSCEDTTTVSSNERSCREMHANMSIIDVPNSTWNDFDVKPNDWQRLICPAGIPDGIAEIIPTYLVSQEDAKIVQRDQGSLLYKFAESNIVQKNMRSRFLDGCTQTFSDIVSYTWRDENNIDSNMTLYMETKCSEVPHSNGYCWLTGRYHNLTDTPGTPWHTMTDNLTAKDRFVCYSVADEGVVRWFIFMVGILFGWLGTVDLAFNWIARFCCRPNPGAEQSLEAAVDAPDEEEQTGKDASGTSTHLEVDSGEAVAPDANLETDFRLNIGLETDVASGPSLHSAGGGPSGPIMELAKKLSRTRTYSKIRVN